MGRRGQRRAVARGQGDPARLARLTALYDRVPEIDCKGTCWDGCSRLPLTTLEQRRIRTETGIAIPHTSEIPARGPFLCPALTMLKLCAVHTLRPLVCRLWGTWDLMPCNYNCMPAGGRLSVIEGYELMAQAEELDGRPSNAAFIRSFYDTEEKAAAFTADRLASVTEQSDDYARLKLEAHSMGRTTFYVRGPGQISSTPDRPDR